MNGFTLKKQLFKFTVFYRSRRHSKNSWYSFDLHVFEGFGSNKFGIMMMTLKEMSFKCESLTHSFKSLVISSIYLLPHAADDKRKRSLCQKNDLIVYVIYSARANNFTILWPAISSCHVHNIIFCWRMVDWLITHDSPLSRSLSLSLHLFIWRFKPASNYKLCYGINSKLQRTCHSELKWQIQLWVRYVYDQLIALAESLLKLC